MNTAIKRVEAREILDSRGNPTVEAEVHLRDGSVGVAAVPSGASTGVHEALELRDGGKAYGGKGVDKAVKNVNTKIRKKLRGMDARKQRKIDEAMIALDGTENKMHLGANAILAVSLANARAAAASARKPLYKYIRSAFRLKVKGWKLPLDTMNIINGGRHADNGLSVQEFMIVPMHKRMSERIRIGAEVFHTLGKLLHNAGYTTGVGDEGGYAPELKSNEDAIKFVMKAIKKAGYTPGKHVNLATDIAASEFYTNGKYYFSKRTGWTAKRMTQEMQKWMKKYPFISIEDPLDQDDWENWPMTTKALGKQVAVVGDDLFVTNKKRLARGIKEGVANAILIKLNQIGTLSETIDAIVLAQKYKYKVSVSHRSGETADTFIADLAVAVGADFLKAGSLSRSDRIEKYNRMMKIEMEVSKKKR